MNEWVVEHCNNLIMMVSKMISKHDPEDRPGQKRSSSVISSSTNGSSSGGGGAGSTDYFGELIYFIGI